MDLTNSADVAAIFADTAPLEVRYDFAEAPGIAARTLIVKRFVKGSTLLAARDAARFLTTI